MDKEKAKAYDMALENAKHYHSEMGDDICCVLEECFPILKESEDDVMRAMAIKAVHAPEAQSCIKSWGINPDDVIAWLEKQESYYTFEIKEGHWYKCVCDYMLNGSDLMFKNDRLYYCRSNWRLRGEIDERNVKDIGVNGYKSFFRPATNQEIKDWLEKRSEQKPVEWHREDEQNLNACLGYIPDEFLRKWLTDVIHTKYDKPADKVEPKFKTGTYVVYLNDTYMLEDDGKHYILTAVKKNASTPVVHIHYGDEDYTMRKWNIADAKDGDVLRIRNLTFIFQEITNNNVCHKDAAVAYCSYEDNDDGFCVCGPDCITDLEIITPATKEQRKKLFAAMRDAGFEWDAENKQLKEIEKKEELTEFENIVEEIADTSILNAYGVKELAKRLLSNAKKQLQEEFDKQLRVYREFQQSNGTNVKEIWK